ncbi:hypothetical protein K438DRAFT_1902637 [Mycena galopus ATCC 62051]|nr:hypothetical protein K438DRAFT_1902637 [Mycena galopus ATCC 62051]
MHSSVITLALAVAASARPARTRRASFDLANGQAAIALNAQFATLTPTSACTAGEDACVNQQFAQCVNGAFVLQACAATTVCAALPQVGVAGTTIACTTPADVTARIAATGATSAGATAANSTTTTAPPDTAANTTTTSSTSTSTTAPPPPDSASGGDQSSLTLDSSVIQTTDDGQNPPVTGQSAAATSTNNFMNFCAGQTITNGLQITTGSCNPIPSFQSPANLDTIPASTSFNITLKTQGIQLGTFTNAAKTYFANPQTLNAQGQIIGHTHVVIELCLLQGCRRWRGCQRQRRRPVAGGLPAGAYRMCTIVSSATHQPAIVPVAQHGSLDDCVYFTSS